LIAILPVVFCFVLQMMHAVVGPLIVESSAGMAGLWWAYVILTIGGVACLVALLYMERRVLSQFTFYQNNPTFPFIQPVVVQKSHAHDESVIDEPDVDSDESSHSVILSAAPTTLPTQPGLSWSHGLSKALELIPRLESNYQTALEKVKDAWKVSSSKI
jgi:hypothetical protein